MSGQGKHQSSFRPGFLLLVAAGTLVWLIWNESFTLTRLLQGAILSWLAFSLTNRFLLKQPYQQVYRIRPLKAIMYLWILLIAIFRSGIHAIYITVTGQIDVGMAELPSQLENPFELSLVATAITLTPGTVTLACEPGMFKVIWIECGSRDPAIAADLIKGDFERLFVPGNQTPGSGGEVKQ